jgi:hypothetical protein
MRSSAVRNNRMILMLGEPHSGTSEQARRHGLSEARFEMLPMIERLAWNWAILNEKALEDVAAIDTVKVLRYRDICERPVREARALFRFTGLSWDQQTEDFIARTSASLDHWRKELSLGERRRILAVVRKTSLASLRVLRTLQSHTQLLDSCH